LRTTRRTGFGAGLRTLGAGLGFGFGAGLRTFGAGLGFGFEAGLRTLGAGLGFGFEAGLRTFGAGLGFGFGAALVAFLRLDDDVRVGLAFLLPLLLEGRTLGAANVETAKIISTIITYAVLLSAFANILTSLSLDFPPSPDRKT
jgi:hypothetical protein